jgi:PAS domain S-box-containing protein/putative nucleotidyltransferase with HDIG domain
MTADNNKEELLNKLAEVEAALHESHKQEARFRSVISTATDAIICADLAGNVIVWNDAAENVFGFTPEDMINQSLTVILAPPWDGIFQTELQRVISTGRSEYLGKTFEARGRKNNGQEFPAEVTVSLWEAKEESFLTLIIRDITERKEAEEEMLEFTSYLDKIINSLSDPIFVKDEKHRWVLMNNALCDFLGYKQEELIGRSDFDFFPKEQAQVFWDKDEAVFGTGKENANQEQITNANGAVRTIVTKKTLYIDKKGRKFLVGIIRDITDQNKVGDSLKESYEKLQRTLIGTADALATALEKRDPYTAGHEKRVAQVACAIAAELGYAQDQIDGIRITAFLHDIGKIVVPAEILSKPSKLNEYEYSIVKTHPEVGYDILKGLEFPWPVAKIVLQHHERLNGSGYPNALSGADMLPEAKILAVADVVEAMVSHRPYRPAKTVDEALQEITQNRGLLYDPKVVDACVTVFREKHFTFDAKPGR